METSDSECFESAGEEFYSDEEDNRKNKKEVKKEGKKTEGEKKSGDVNEKKTLGKEISCKKEDIKYSLEQLKTGYVDAPEIVDCWEEGVNVKKKDYDNMWDDDWDIDDDINVNDDDVKVNKDDINVNKDDINVNEADIKVKETKESLKNDFKVTEEKSKENIQTENKKSLNIDAKQLLEEVKNKESLKIDKKEPFGEVKNKESLKEIENKLLETKISPKTQEKDDTIKNIDNWEENWDDWDDSKPINKPSEESNAWEDDWEPIEEPPKQKSSISQQESKKDTGWGSWGSWGLSSVISTASTITSQVSQSITTVLESGIGAPNPEELAKIDREIEKEVENISDDEETYKNSSNSTEKAPNSTEKLSNLSEKPTLFHLGSSLVQGVTKLVETTGSKVITGGLDTFETIGKKTMEVLQENDPGLKKKRAFLALTKDDKPILSQMLREAKEKAERENFEMEKKEITQKRPNYESLFDDYQGLVHLEALEMLSKQCDIKLSCLMDASSPEALIEMQETLEQIKELCELPEDDEEEDEEEGCSKEKLIERIETAIKDLNVPISYDKLILMWNQVENWLNEIKIDEIDSKEVHQRAIESLAELTAVAVEQFHKGGELLLVKQHRSTADEADSLVQLTVTLSTLIGIVSAKFSETLNRIIENGGEKTEVNELITNVFYEAANSTRYIKDAFQLLIPVLQVGAV